MISDAQQDDEGGELLDHTGGDPQRDNSTINSGVDKRQTGFKSLSGPMQVPHDDLCRVYSRCTMCSICIYPYVYRHKRDRDSHIYLINLKVPQMQKEQETEDIEYIASAGNELKPIPRLATSPYKTQIGFKNITDASDTTRDLLKVLNPNNTELTLAHSKSMPDLLGNVHASGNVHVFKFDSTKKRKLLSFLKSV